MKNYIKHHRVSVALASILMVLISIGLVYGSYGRIQVVNDIINKSNEVYKNIVILIVVIISTQLLQFVSAIVNAKLIKKWILELSRQVNKKIINLEFKGFHNTSTGEYISWYTKDLELVVMYQFEPFFKIFSQGTLVILSFISIILISWKLALCLVIGLVIMMKVSSPLGAKTGLAYQVFAQGIGIFTEKLKEYTAGYDLLKNTNQLSLYDKEVNKAQNTVEDLRIKTKIRTAISGLAGNSSKYIIEILVFSLAVYLAFVQEISLGAIVALPTLILLFLDSGMATLEIWIQMRYAKPMIDKITVFEPLETELYPELKEAIKLENISFAYPTKQIFEDLSFTFEKDKKYAIVGESGKGKSTLIKLLLGRLSPTSGKYLVDDQLFAPEKDIEFANQIGYVSQEGYLFNTSIRNNICLDEKFDDEQIWAILKEVCLYDYVMSLPEKLDSQIGALGEKISGGEKQRISLARVLIRNTPILILDEATSAIDAKTTQMIENNIFAKKGTLIVISHHLSEATRNRFDQIYEL